MKSISVQQGISRIASYALPISAANLVNVISGFVAMLMVAQLGQIELAAGALALSTYITLMTIVATSLYAIGILISHYNGQEGAACEIGKIVKNGIWVSCLMTIPVSIILWHADTLLLLFGQNKQLVQIAKPYFHYAALGLFPILIAGVISQFNTGIGNPKFTMITALIRLPIIILLSFGFIFGKFGLPQLGLAGVMCASFIVQSLYCICVIFYLYRKENIKKYRLFSKPFAPHWMTCKKIFTLGMPIGLQFGGELGAMTTATYLVGFFGVSALAASQIVSQYAILVVMMTLGLSQALSVLISNAYAKHDYNLIKKYLVSALIMLSVVFVFVAMIFLLFPNALIKIYMGSGQGADMNTIRLAIYFFAIAGVVLFVDGIRNLISGALRGLHDSSSPMKIGIICLWLIALPMCCCVGFVFHGGPVGLRIGFSSGFLIAAVLLFRRIHKKLQSLSFENSGEMALNSTDPVK